MKQGGHILIVNDENYRVLYSTEWMYCLWNQKAFNKKRGICFLLPLL